MAPRKLTPDDDDTSSLASEALKPKTAKAKVAKPKVEKPKVEKVKVEKVKKEVVKKEKVEGAVPKKRKVTASAASPSNDGEGEGEGDGEGEVKKKAKKEVVKKEKDGEKPKLDKDGKEKVKAVNGEEAVQMMLAYLKEQNRPYSATEVSANLHGKVTKTVADKLLKEMENNGQIMGKATKKDGGGQWVFWTIQDAADSASPEELLAMDAQINILKESLPPLKTTFKTLTTKLNTLLSAPTTAELVVIIDKLREENAAKKEKLQGFQVGSIKMVTKEDLDRTEKELKYWTARRKARVDGFKALWDMLKEGLGEDKLAERVEMDEDPYLCSGVGGK